jgi:tetratricopeptide (TPR) repeat protein
LLYPPELRGLCTSAPRITTLGAQRRLPERKPRTVTPCTRIVRLIPATALFAASVHGQTGGADARAADRLGDLEFPNSGAAAAQNDFIRGVLFLHSFEYESAALAFRAAQRVDPGFALAYWGEAMTYTHPIWNQQDVPAARAALNRLGLTQEVRNSRAGSARERDYLSAVEALYGDGSKPVRDTLFARRMERVAATYPDDVEAQLFFALALMGLSQGVRNVPTYMRAGAIAEGVFEQHPNHPGAAHYVIHAFDDPVHAPLGLRAARAYSRIAPSAGHAQHMTTHIFLALGMWPQVVKQNEIAQEATLRTTDRTRWFAGHYTSWLGYALLQQGRFDAARSHLLLIAENEARSSRSGGGAALGAMRAAYLVETERWTDTAVTGSAALSAPGAQHPGETFARGFAGLRTSRRSRAEGALATLEGSLATPDQSPQSQDPHTRVMAAQLRALLLADEGNKDGAIALLRRTAAIEDTVPVEFGPPVVVKPTHELIGELLLGMGRARAAQHEFARALEQGPRRLRALAGLVRAATAAGDRATADEARRTLAETLADADAGLLDRLLRGVQ